jgi:hypothetical protein
MLLVIRFSIGEATPINRVLSSVDRAEDACQYFFNLLVNVPWQNTVEPSQQSED